MRFPGFIGPSYTLQSVNVDCQRCVNLFPEINGLGTGKEREVAALVPTPGLRLLLTLPESPVRGLWRASNGTLFAVGGIKLYSISSAWVATEVGSLGTSTGPVSMADNGTTVFVVDGTGGYTCTVAGASFATITDPDFYASVRVTYQDGYFIFTKPNTQNYFITDLNATTFDALDISSAEGSPDRLVTAESSNQNLYLFGVYSTEVHSNTGNPDFPFERISGAVIGVGCAAAQSVAKMQGEVYWIGGDDTGNGAVYKIQGYQAQRVSTPAIESVIRTLGVTNLSNARAWTYQQGGHYFYCLNIPGHDSTWVYDASTQLWHERQYLELWSLERHRGDCHAAAYGENVVGDYENGKVYALDPAKYTDDTTPIKRIRTAPHLSGGMRRQFHSSFQLDMEVGVGLTSGQGVDPQVMLQWSDDGGHTWSNERWAAAGALGNTKTRVIWRRLGASRDRVYRVSVSDPVKVVMIGAELGIEEGGA